MDPFEQQALIDEERSAFKDDLPSCSDAPLMVRLVTERIHRRLFDPGLAIRRLKKHFGLTDAVFSTRFRRYHGRPPKRYARRLRVRAAKRLLRHEELPITDIAFAVGYEHYRSFARVFKRRVGLSPSAFRKERSE